MLDQKAGIVRALNIIICYMHLLEENIACRISSYLTSEGGSCSTDFLQNNRPFVNQLYINKKNKN